MKSNETIEILLNRRSIRNFERKEVSDEDRALIEKAAQQAATSEFRNAWSAIRVEDLALRKQIVDIAQQPYLGDAGLFYVFLVDTHRNRSIAIEQGDDPSKVNFKDSYSFFEGYQDALLAAAAMATAAESLGLGTLFVGALNADIDRVIEMFHLPAQTYPVVGLAVGHIAFKPALKPRMPVEDQIFADFYPSDKRGWSKDLEGFSKAVSSYVDVRHPETSIPPYLDSIKRHALEEDRPVHIVEKMKKQGFKAD